MASRSALTPDLIVQAYTQGLFPMAESAGALGVHWLRPARRGILPLDNFHISRSLRRALLRCDYDISINRDFQGVMAGCADREETWINADILRVFGDLHTMGCAHSLEVWRGGALIGGVYGLALGGAFFAESMFSRQTDASKIALAWLVHRLRAGGFGLMDTQYLTTHLASLGGVEVPSGAYMQMLAAALARPGQFAPAGYQPSCGVVSSGAASGSGSGASSITGGASGVRQRSTQTS